MSMVNFNYFTDENSENMGKWIGIRKLKEYLMIQIQADKDTHGIDKFTGFFSALNQYVTGGLEQLIHLSISTNE